ncbi:hypothetical protein [Roseateles sp. P5_E1]
MHLHASKEALKLGHPLSVLTEEGVPKDIFGLLGDVAGTKVPRQRGGHATPTTSSLEHYLDAVAAEIEEAFAEADDLFQGALLKAAARGTGNSICTRCAAQAGASAHVCTFKVADQVKDLAAVTDRGLCLQPITELFDYCAKLAGRLYGLSASAEPLLILETGFEQAHNEMMDSVLHGSVREAAPRGGRTCRLVSIKLSAGKWRPSDYLGIVTVLFHECFSHGFCAVNVQQGLQSIAFHEGWMDCVGVAALRGELNRLPNQVPPAECLGGQHVAYLYRSEFLGALDLLHMRRYGASASLFPEVNDYIKGKNALEALRKMLMIQLAGEVTDLESVAAKTLLTASTALNADSSWTHEERGRFVSAMVQCFAKPSHELVDEAVKKHSITRSLESLIAHPKRHAVKFARQVQAIAAADSPFT